VARRRGAGDAKGVLDARDRPVIEDGEDRGVVLEAVVAGEPLEGDPQGRRGAHGVVQHVEDSGPEALGGVDAEGVVPRAPRRLLPQRGLQRERDPRVGILGERGPESGRPLEPVRVHTGGGGRGHDHGADPRRELDVVHGRTLPRRRPATTSPAVRQHRTRRGWRDGTFLRSASPRLGGRRHAQG
jgi:hypothetical protein